MRGFWQASNKSCTVITFKVSKMNQRISGCQRKNKILLQFKDDQSAPEPNEKLEGDLLEIQRLKQLVLERDQQLLQKQDQIQELVQQKMRLI